MSEVKNDIESRLLRIERTNRLLILSLISLLLTIVVLALFYYFKSVDVITAKKIQLLGTNNQPIAELAVKAGSAGLYLYDENAKTRLSLFHSNEATGLYINDSHEVTRVGAVQFDHGGGGFALHGEDAKGAAVLYYKNSGSLRFFDKQGEVANSLFEQAKTEN